VVSIESLLFGLGPLGVYFTFFGALDLKIQINGFGVLLIFLVALSEYVAYSTFNHRAEGIWIENNY
jgi:hypothetical protein